jgi:hypothetical protein
LSLQPFTAVPASRVGGGGNPPGDMNSTSLQLLALGSSCNVMNAAYGGGADPTGTNASDTAFNDAIGALPAAGGAILIPPGTYKISSGIVAATALAGIYLVPLLGPNTVTLAYYGSGDCVRMYSTNGTSPPSGGGGLRGGITIDMTHATGSASALHLGDIFQPRLDCKIANIPAGCIGAWIDNQYTYTEQVTGKLYIDGCSGTGLQLDNSTGTGTSANATGSFDRIDLDVWVSGMAGNVVVLDNGAFWIDGQLRVHGNVIYGASMFYVLTLTGSNGGGYSRLGSAAILKIGAELKVTSGTKPGTIDFASAGNNVIAGASGYLDFSGNAAFAAANNPTNSFQFDGPIFGDATLNRTRGGGAPYNAGGSALASNGSIPSGSDVITMNPVAGITGMILEKWDVNLGAPISVTIVNRSAYPITFAASGTSNVSTGTACTIGPLASMTFWWDSFDSLWVPATAPVSGQYLCPPVQYAPATQVLIETLSATMASLNAAATTVASGSNGGEISAVASWSSPSAGVLDVASTAGWPSAGKFTVATSTTTATCTYSGITATSLTGCAYVSGSATGTVATGGAVTLIGAGTGYVTPPGISTGSFTAPASGSVLVTANFMAYVSAGSTNMSFGLAADGTVTPMVCDNVTFTDSAASSARMYTPVFLVSGLTPGGSYDFDLMFAVASGTLTVRALGSESTTPTGTLGLPVTMTVQAV